MNLQSILFISLMNGNAWKAINKTLKAWQNRHYWAEMDDASFRLYKKKFPAIPEAYFLEQLSR